MKSPSSIDVLAATVADPTRRRLLERLLEAPGSSTGELADGVGHLSRFAVMKHLAVLREAGLVRTMAAGRHRRHYAEPAALAPLRAWLERFAVAGTPGGGAQRA